MTKFGFSFSLNRLLGITRIKQKIAVKTGVPITKEDLRKFLPQISNPSSPVIIGNYPLSPVEDPTGIFISGNYAYVISETGTNSLFILDISDPTTPVKVSSVSVGINTLKKVEFLPR